MGTPKVYQYSNNLQAPVSWEPVDVTPIMKDGKQTIPSETIESIKRNKVALKGPLAVSHTQCHYHYQRILYG